MKKELKLLLTGKDGIPPEGLGALLSKADEQDLRVLVGLLLSANREDGTVRAEELPDLIGMEASSVEASLKFWRGAGVLETGKAVKAEKTSAPSEKKTAPAHRGGAVERTATLGEYSTAELATLMEQRRISAEFVDEAQRIIGKIFRVYDTGILVGIVDQLGFEEEAVLAILAYIVRRGKKTLRYAEQMAMALYDEGLTDTEAVLARIHRMEQSAETVTKIKQLFGFGSRELTATEKKLFTTWTETFGYDLEVVRLAYDITVDTIQKPVPKYAGSILESWHKEGLRTAEEVGRYLETSREKKKAAEESEHTPKSYDLDEFFEAAVRRGLKDLT